MTDEVTTPEPETRTLQAGWTFSKCPSRRQHRKARKELWQMLYEQGYPEYRFEGEDIVFTLRGPMPPLYPFRYALEATVEAEQWKGMSV